MEYRLEAIRATPGNQICADCPAINPQWASFLIPRVEVDRKLGVLCCENCAQHHHFELGVKRCMIKYLRHTHEWTEEDAEILEYSGNDFVNSIFEANLKESGYNKDFVLADEEEETIIRGKFIKYKYKKRKYQDEVIYYKKMLQLLLGGKQEDNDEKESNNTAEPMTDNKRKSMRRLKSVPQCVASQIAGQCSTEQYNSMSRCNSSPSLHHQQHQRVVKDEEYDVVDRATTQPVLRRKSTVTKSNPLHGRGCHLSPRGGGRRRLTVVESPKVEMRNRRLSAFANACFDLSAEFEYIPPSSAPEDNNSSTGRRSYIGYAA